MPPNFGFYARTIRESDFVSREIESAKTDFHRIEEIFDGWKYRLARQPEILGYPIAGTNPQRYLVKTAPQSVAGVPIITMLYSFDDNYVDIEAIKIEVE